MATFNELKKETQDLVVLYAEDEKTIKSIMTASLQKLFKDVIVAEDGEEAFSLFLENQDTIDLIITDISMPKLDGINLTAKIKEHTENSSQTTPPIIITTAHSDEESLLKLIELNIDKFLSKPFNKEKIIQSLYSLCRSINDRKMVEEYREKLENSLLEAEKKNRILEVKLNQIAEEKNRQKVEEKEVETTTEDDEYSNYFESLKQEDLDELEELSSEIDSFITMTFQTEKLNEEYIEKFAKAYIAYGQRLGNYSLFLTLASAIIKFGKTIHNNKENFEKHKQELSLLLESLHFTFNSFREHVLKVKSDRPDFYNASLISDLAFIENILQGQEEQGSGVELF